MAISPTVGGPMDDVDRRASSLSGLTDAEAREFHGIFVMSFAIFTVIAIIAHILAWWWRPWIPGVNGYKTSLLDGLHVHGVHALHGVQVAMVHVLPALT